MPVTVKRAIELMGLFVLATVIMKWQLIIMPLILAVFVAIVLLPIYRFLRKKRMPEVIAIILSLLLFVLVVGALIWFVWWQVQGLVADFPAVRKNIQRHIDTISTWIDTKMNFPAEKQKAFIQEQRKSFSSYTSTFFRAAGSFGSILIFVGLLPIYTFLILYYKSMLLRFVFYWFPEKNHPKIKEVVHETESIIKSYLIGLLIQITYITILLGGTLSIIGIKHGLLIGIIFAILNLIPYIGALFGNIIGVLLTLSSSNELWPVITVLLVIAAVQFLDNNILMPGIVGSKIKINPLAGLIGVFTGGTLAGIAGMFLSLPVLAVLKIIFDRTEQFKQWGILFGDNREPKVYRKFIKSKERKSKEDNH